MTSSSISRPAGYAVSLTLGLVLSVPYSNPVMKGLMLVIPPVTMAIARRRTRTDSSVIDFQPLIDALNAGQREHAMELAARAS